MTGLYKIIGKQSPVFMHASLGVWLTANLRGVGRLDQSPSAGHLPCNGHMERFRKKKFAAARSTFIAGLGNIYTDEACICRNTSCRVQIRVRAAGRHCVSDPQGAEGIRRNAHP
jgi:hypothetical protein